MQWTEEDKENARQKAEENSCIRIPLEEQGKGTLSYYYITNLDQFKENKYYFI